MKTNFPLHFQVICSRTSSKLNNCRKLLLGMEKCLLTFNFDKPLLQLILNVSKLNVLNIFIWLLWLCLVCHTLYPSNMTTEKYLYFQTWIRDSSPHNIFFPSLHVWAHWKICFIMLWANELLSQMARGDCIQAAIHLFGNETKRAPCLVRVLSVTGQSFEEVPGTLNSTDVLHFFVTWHLPFWDWNKC